MKKLSICNCVNFLKKSGLKAGDGQPEGLFPFYTSSQKISKYTDEPVYEGESLVLGTGGSASLHYSSDKFSASNDCYVVQVKVPEVSTKYLYHFLYSNIHLLEEGFKGAGLKHVSKKHIENIKVPIPPLEEQERIAAILDKADALRCKREKATTLADDLLRSVFINMFGDPITNPKGFPMHKVGDYINYLADIGSNGANAVVAEKLVMSDEEDYALMVRTVNLSKNDFTGNVKFVSKEVYNFFKKSKIYGGEIIMNKIGSAGQFWIMPHLNRPVSLGLNQFVIRLKDLDVDYLYYFLSTEFGKSNINNSIRGVATKSITKSAVRDLPLMLPPREMQEEFSKIVLSVKSINEKYCDYLDTSNTLFSSLTQRAFRGDLTTQKEAA